MIYAYSEGEFDLSENDGRRLLLAESGPSISPISDGFDVRFREKRSFRTAASH